MTTTTKADRVTVEIDGLGPAMIVSNGGSLYVYNGDVADGVTPVWNVNSVDYTGSVHVDVPADGEPWAPDWPNLSRYPWQRKDATPAAVTKSRRAIGDFLTTFAASEKGADFIQHGRWQDAVNDLDRIDERLRDIDKHRAAVELQRTEALTRKAMLTRGDPDPGAIEPIDCPRWL